MAICARPPRTVAIAIPAMWWQTDRLHQRDDQERAQDGHHVEHRGGQRRQKEPVQRVQHPHHRDRDRDGRQKRHHDPGQLRRERELPRQSRELGARTQSYRVIEMPDVITGDRRREQDARTTIAPVATSSVLMTRLPRRHAASRPRVWRVFVNVGTKAAVMAPSAKRSRTRLGTRNATLKASMAGVAEAPNSSPTPFRGRPPAAGSPSWRYR